MEDASDELSVEIQKRIKKKKRFEEDLEKAEVALQENEDDIKSPYIKRTRRCLKMVTFCRRLI